MIWLTGISICLFLLAADLQMGSSQSSDVGLQVSLVVLAALVAPSFAAVQSLAGMRRWQSIDRELIPVERIRQSNLLFNFFVWISCCTAIIFVLQWPTVVRVNWGLDRWPLADELLITLPLLASVAASWALLLDVDGLAGRTTGNSRTRAIKDRLVLVGQRLRTFCGLVVVPVLALFLVRDLASEFAPSDDSGFVLGTGFSGLLVGLWAAYPLIASATWKTAPLADRELQNDLHEICRARGRKPEHVRIWDTDGTLVNAVVVGMLPGFRRIFLTDELLRRFEPQEIHAIFRHELGHIVHHHLWTRGAVLLGPLLLVFLIGAMFFENGIAIWPVGSLSLPWLVWTIAPLTLLFWFVAVVIPIIRRSELQADQYAVLDADGRPSRRLASDYCGALLKIAASNPESYLRGSAIHPGIRTRIRSLRSMVQDQVQDAVQETAADAGSQGSPLVLQRRDTHIGCSLHPGSNRNSRTEEATCHAQTRSHSRGTQ